MLVFWNQQNSTRKLRYLIAFPAFLVDSDSKGLTVRRGPKCVSNRGYHTFELFFDDCRISSKKVLGEIGKGWSVANEWLTAGRVMVAANCVGQAQRALEASLSWSADRNQFGKPIGSFQLIQEKLAWMLNEITKGQLLAMQVGKNKDNNTLKFQQVSMIKRNNVWVARECCKLARDIHGANGISGEYPVMRHLMNMESVYTYEGTYDMHTLILGENITGISAFR